MSVATRRGMIVFVLGVLFLAGALGFDYFMRDVDTEATPLGASIGGPFALVDQNGVLRHDTDFRGKLMLVYFGYSSCPDACPTTLTEISDALDLLGPAAQQVQPIFITVDPARDTPAQLKAYAANFGSRLIALTGSDSAIAAAARAYRVYYKKVEDEGAGGYLMDHSSFIYLMGRDGRYLALFATGVKPQALAAGIKRYM